jgi:hypothetical protein
MGIQERSTVQVASEDVLSKGRQNHLLGSPRPNYVLDLATCSGVKG